MSRLQVKEKLANLVMFDKATYDKMLKEIPKAGTGDRGIFLLHGVVGSVWWSQYSLNISCD